MWQDTKGLNKLKINKNTVKQAHNCQRRQANEEGTVNKAKLR